MWACLVGSSWPTGVLNKHCLSSLHIGNEESEDPLNSRPWQNELSVGYTFDNTLIFATLRLYLAILLFNTCKDLFLCIHVTLLTVEILARQATFNFAFA